MSAPIDLTPGTVTAGDSYTSYVLIVDSAGDDATPSAATVKWQPRGETGSFDVDLSEADAEVTLSAGKAECALAPADTSSLVAGDYDVEWVVTAPGGTRTARQRVTVRARLA